jgi:ubiquinone/menaquinone biosynthesis C-methylase UbiE
MAGERCPEAHVKVGSVFSLEFEDESLDIVTASLVYDHVDDLERAFGEVQRVLKSGGLFVFSVPHPTTYMFRDSEKDQFVPTRSYFDKQVLYHNIARSGKNFPAYPRIMQEYFQFFLENGFVLREFVENKPQDSWKEKYPDLDKNFYKLPSICFLKWEKS